MHKMIGKAVQRQDSKALGDYKELVELLHEVKTLLISNPQPFRPDTQTSGLKVAKKISALANFFSKSRPYNQTFNTSRSEAYREWEPASKSDIQLNIYGVWTH